MKLFTPLYLCLLILSGIPSFPSYSQVNVKPIPTWVKHVTREDKASHEIAQEVSGGYYYLLIDRQYEVEEKSTYHHFALEILSEQGIQNASEINVSYDPSYEKVFFHEVSVIRQGETINKLRPNSFKVIQREASADRYIYDGTLNAIAHLEDVRVGDIIEYSYSRAGRNPVYEDKFFTSFYLNYYTAVGKIYIRISTPSSRKLEIKNLNHELQAHVEQKKGKTSYEWEQHKVFGKNIDDGAPSWYDPYAKVMVSEYQNWQELKQWAQELYQLPATADKNIREKAEEIMAGNDMNEDRVMASLRFVQDEIRYLGMEDGISGYKPHAPSKVLAQRFGDCKDKSLLLCALLKEMDIEAYPALVNTTYRHEIVHWLPSPYAFDHCVAVVKLYGKEFWVDPTAALQRGNMEDIYFPDYGKGLVINQKSKGLSEVKASQLARTEVEENFAINHVDSVVILDIITKYYGYEADHQRSVFNSNSLSELEKSYLNYNASIYPEISIESNLSYHDNEADNVFTTFESYKVNQLWQASNEDAPDEIQLEVYPLTLSEVIIKPNSSIRTMPWRLNYPTAYKHVINFELFEPWQVNEQAYHINNEYVDFTANIKYNPYSYTISLAYTYDVLKNVVEAEDIKAFVKDQKEIEDMLGYSLTYSKALRADAGPSTYLMILGMGILAVSIVYARKVYYHYNPPSEHGAYAYESIGGLLVLVAIGLTVSPLYILYNLFTGDYFNLETLKLLFNGASASHNPFLGGLILFEFAFNIGMLVFNVLLIILFYEKRSSLPQLIIIFYAVNLFFIFSETMAIESMNLLGAVELQEAYRQLGKSFLSALIWIPYFIKSERVKETFVNFRSTEILVEES